MKTIASVLICLSTFFISAQENIVQNDIKGFLGINQQQITSLGEAIPEAQYGWRPAEGVRSVGEVLLHVAGANYYFASKLGFAPPEDVNIMTIETITGKENILAILKKSFDFVQDNLGQVSSADFSKEIDLGFAKMDELSTMLLILDHSGEHKGQLIAYARSNGITPPWSK
ncbi:MAG: DinB family protein [Maribacter sp.]|nr:DinB family protein [Maribacter sp.]